MNQEDVIAYHLAARHDPAVRDLEAYQTAEVRLRDDPALQHELEVEARYYDEHGDLLAAIQLSPEARLRILDAIREELGTSPLPLGKPAESRSQPVRWLALAAAILALLGGVYLALRPAAPTLDDFRTFAGNEVQAGFNLDHLGVQPDDLVAWLRSHGMKMGDLDHKFTTMDSMGCKLYAWRRQQVALICFRNAEHDIVHLFMTPRASLRSPPTAETVSVVADRKTTTWADDENAYVLVTHDPVAS